MPTFAPQPLTEFVAALWRSLGVPPDDAGQVASALVGCNLAGHDSHGVIRITQWVEHLRDGRLRPGAPIRVTRDLPAAAVVDGGWNFGLLAARRAMELAVGKARAVGVGAVGLCQAHHIGRLADYCELAAGAGCIAQVVANNHGVAAAVPPWGGIKPRLATNPMAFGLPRRDGPPIVVDITTAVAPEGKIRVLRNRGELAPDGWLLDNQGRPTRDPNDFYAEPRGAILPLGGDVGYKGYGLSVAVEALAGALSGALCTRATPPALYGNAAFFTAWSVEAVQPGGHYEDEIERLVQSLRDCPTADGVEEILLPGEPEQRTRERRQRDGIPVDDTTWSELAALAAEQRVEAPPAVTR
ncbi:MAG: Ldh family oxidoreductase [Armatimonadetes bacterium]|nr:Ldh family oxidoreductase [Armatimonadota bacterium]